MLVNNLHEDFVFHVTIAEMPRALHTRLHRSKLPPKPRNYQELLRHPHRAEFEAVMGREWNTLWKKGTFEEVLMEIARKVGIKLIPLIWVLDYKFDDDRYLLKYKAYLVARGDL